MTTSTETISDQFSSITNKPILEILRDFCKNHNNEIDEWFTKLYLEAPPFFYSSVDLRHSGNRLVPIDTNIFPAGFNNLSPVARKRATICVNDFLSENYPDAKNIIIIPENHTRNLAYFDNLLALSQIIENTGANVKIGSLAAGKGEVRKFISAEGKEIIQHPILKKHFEVIGEDGFKPDLIIMNNDMTAGIPEILQNVIQPIIPSTNMGWFRRRKSTHFSEYDKLITEFCDKFSIDKWLLSAKSHQCGLVNFKNKESLRCLAKSVDEILSYSKEKYKKYGIEQEPYVYIKADSGTYGMGIMSVYSANEVLELNKKERNKMQTIKEGVKVSEVIIQEGIPTIDKVDGVPAEPLIYLINGVAVGGMYRINDRRDSHGNLNASGMRFTGMCDESEEECGKWKKIPNCSFRSHGIIASIAALAAARETY
ncbi:MAG: glutamate--cysteine ligase [Rickettsiales bacterium]